MQEGCFCFLTPSYYIRFTDPYLMRSKEDGGGRPFFFTFRDTLHPHIMWLVPISRADNKMNKYQDVIQRKIRLYGRCDTIILGTVLGQRAAFLIQNMCPAVEQYIADIYIQQSTNLPVAIRRQERLAVERAAKSVWARIKRKAEAEAGEGKPISKNGFVFPDIFSIYMELLRDFPAPQQPEN